MSKLKNKSQNIIFEPLLNVVSTKNDTLSNRRMMMRNLVLIASLSLPAFAFANTVVNLKEIKLSGVNPPEISAMTVRSESITSLKKIKTSATSSQLGKSENFLLMTETRESFEIIANTLCEKVGGQLESIENKLPHAYPNERTLKHSQYDLFVFFNEGLDITIKSKTDLGDAKIWAFTEDTVVNCSVHDSSSDTTYPKGKIKIK